MIIGDVLFLTQEKALVNRYAVAAAENDQKLNQLGLAKNIMAQVNLKKLDQMLLTIIHVSQIFMLHFSNSTSQI